MEMGHEATVEAAEFNNGEQAEIPAVAAANEEEVGLLSGVLLSLPPVAVKDLLAMGVCFQCILRIFGKYGPGHFQSPRLLDIISSCISGAECSDEELNRNGGSSGSDSSLLNEADICCICCGILQFNYIDDSKTVVKHKCANDFAVTIGDLVKEKGHQTDGFSLEVSIPPVILENENAVRLLMNRKYASEAWFQGSFVSEIISVKDALKLSIINCLEAVLAVKCGLSSFRIRLTYSGLEEYTKNEANNDKNHFCKRRKTDSDCREETVKGLLAGIIEHPDPATDEASVAKGKCSDSSQGSQGKVSACCLSLVCYRMPIYIGGRYLKYSRNVSQTRWIIDDERMGEASVEEIVGSTILPLCQGDNYKFHAAGREDIDVRMLGSGRPFLIEIQNARLVPSGAFIKEMEEKINSSEKKLLTVQKMLSAQVRVKNLNLVDSQGWILMREGEAEKQKQYAALVWISRQLKDDDLETISSLKDTKILQRTPVRVLHRRSPLDREKIIHWMNVEKIAGSSQYFLLHLCTQAGTYIKEFVHGDLGRTHPSIGSILGCRAEILQLDVTDVKMDCFSSN
ncbi:hypothetical protein Ancab_008341 [Ancistrocladus abbreviatus]